MTGNKSLVNVELGKLAGPAKVFIEKVSDAVGGLFKPYQMVRVARAAAEADRISAESQIQVTEIHRRAMYRFLEEEAQKQHNMEAIAQSALPLLEDKSAPQNVADDWITNFFDKARIVSDADMQALWARVLAGEANGPGAFAKRTVNLLGDLDKEDAVLFATLSGFCWDMAGITPLIFDANASMYNNRGINFGALAHLESLGLAQFHHPATFTRTELPKVPTVHYFGRPLKLTLPNESGNVVEIGHLILTRAGQQLAPVCAPAPVDGFFEYVTERWIGRGYLPRPEPDAAGNKG